MSQEVVSCHKRPDHMTTSHVTTGFTTKGNVPYMLTHSLPTGVLIVTVHSVIARPQNELHLNNYIYSAIKFIAESAVTWPSVGLYPFMKSTADVTRPMGESQSWWPNLQVQKLEAGPARQYLVL